MPNPPAISQGTKYSPGRQELKLIRNDLPRFAFESMANHFDSGLSRNDSRPQVIELEYTMAARANWKGYLKLSLVSCAVALYPATSSSTRVRFHTVNRATGNRVKRQFIDPASGEPVEAEDQVKGYEVGRGSYVYVEDEELDAIRIESTHTIDIESFVPRDQVDELLPRHTLLHRPGGQGGSGGVRGHPRRHAGEGQGGRCPGRDRPARADDPAASPSARACLGRFCATPTRCGPRTPTSRTSRTCSCLRKCATSPLTSSNGSRPTFEPSQFEDRYENAVVELVRAKQTGEPVRIEEAPRPSNVVNLMEALRRSIAAEEPAGGPPKAPSKTSEERPARKAKREPSSRKAGPSAKKAG